jgi:hypothetical protein
MMRQLTDQEKQQYQRMLDLSQMARQRYLAAGGDPNLSSGSLHHNSYMTPDELHEFLELARQFGTETDDRL